MHLAEFLLARIGEDEAVARVATGGPWFAVASGVEGAGTVLHDSHILHNDANHITRHDPARVLAECEAKRRIMSLFAPTLADELSAAAGDWNEVAWRGEQVLRYLALPYADHPDYRGEW